MSADSIRELGTRDQINPRTEQVLTVLLIDPAVGVVEEIDIVASRRDPRSSIALWVPAVFADDYDFDGLTVQVEDFAGITFH
ncbi:hypothetical protein SEA_HEXBUG_37 [Gordonia phage Hexbug]|nr:hypothetical protein SEA_ORLA_37 [Gordonia phage Orla]UVK62951.1 hypothetical protein SEA_HEXBUG_37 [Gordonia phage Hexbug]